MTTIQSLSNNTDIFTTSFLGEMMAGWAGTPFIYEAGNLSYFRSATAFLESNAECENDRRLLLYNILAKDFATESAEDSLQKKRDILPSDATFVRRTLRNLCIAYNEAPERDFRSNTSNEGFGSLYEDIAFDSIMSNAYKRAKLCNTVLAIVAIRNGVVDIELRTPDTFRVKTSKRDYLEIEEVWIQNSDGENIIFHVWTNETFKKVDNRGVLLSSDPNPYGVIPCVLLRLSTERDFYGGVFDSLLWTSLDTNKLSYIVNDNAVYSGFTIWLAQNFNLPKDSKFKLQPDKIITVDGVVNPDAGFNLPPSLDAISADAKYLELQDLIERREKYTLRRLGMPNSLIEANSVQSGISRIVEMQELLQMQNEDAPRLRQFERNIARLIAKVSNTDLRTNLDEEIDVKVQFAKPVIFTSPSEEYDLLRRKMRDGFISPAQGLRLIAGDEQVNTDDEAAIIIKRNQEVFSRINIEQNNASTI